MSERTIAPISNSDRIVELALRVRKNFLTRAVLGLGPVSNELTLNRIVKAKKGSFAPTKPAKELTDSRKLDSLGLVCDSGSRFTIFLHPADDCFDIAKQLGHYFLHTNKIKPGRAVFLRQEIEPFETEATTFAMNLLMPSLWFLPLYQKYENDHQKIASIVGTRPEVIRRRVFSLWNAKAA